MEYLNKLLRKSGGKKSEPVGHQLPSEKREIAEENDFSLSQHSTPKKHQDCDTESDTTAEYESAGEASPWEKPSNVSALADYLAGVHLSTPDKIHSKLTSFPFSPISAEDECDDEEVTAIISSRSHSSSHTLSIHEGDELSPPTKDKTISFVADRSFSDVDLDEFENSKPCKRHSEVNIDSGNLVHSEIDQFRDTTDTLIDAAALFSKGELHFKTDIDNPGDLRKMKNPSVSSDIVEISSSVIDKVEHHCESVNDKLISSETVSPSSDVSLNHNNSCNAVGIESDATNLSIDKNINDCKMFEKYSASMKNTSESESFQNKTSHFVSLEKPCVSPIKSQKENNAVTSKIDSVAKVLEGSQVTDYANTAKQKIDIILNSKKEIVSNAISEKKQQIDSMFKHESPLKDLIPSTVSQTNETIKENDTKAKPDLSPHRNAERDCKPSPITAAKQKIDSLFTAISPKKEDMLFTKTSENTPVQEFVLVQDHSTTKSLMNENNVICADVLAKTLTIEKQECTPLESCLDVVSPKASIEKQNFFHSTKQQIDKMFKSLSPQKVFESSITSKISTPSISKEVILENEASRVSDISTVKTVFTQNISERDESQFSLNKVTSSMEQDIVNIKQETDKLMIASLPQKESVVKIVSEECSHELANVVIPVSEVSLSSVEIKQEIADAVMLPVKLPENSLNDELLNKTETEVNNVCDSIIVSVPKSPLKNILNQHRIPEDTMETIKSMDSQLDNAELNHNSHISPVNAPLKEVEVSTNITEEENVDKKQKDIKELTFQNITETDKNIAKCELANEIVIVDQIRQDLDSSEFSELKTPLNEGLKISEDVKDFIGIDIKQKIKDIASEIIVESNMEIDKHSLAIKKATENQIQESQDSFYYTSSINSKKEELNIHSDETNLEIIKQGLRIEKTADNLVQESCSFLHSSSIKPQKEDLNATSDNDAQVNVGKKQEEMKDSTPQNITNKKLEINKQSLTMEEVIDAEIEENQNSCLHIASNAQKNDISSCVANQVNVIMKQEETENSTSQKITEAKLDINKTDLMIEEVVDDKVQENQTSFLHIAPGEPQKEELNAASEDQVIVVEKQKEVEYSTPPNITDKNFEIKKQSSTMEEVTHDKARENQKSFLHTDCVNHQKEDFNITSCVNDQMNIHEKQGKVEDALPHKLTETNIKINKQGLTVEERIEGQLKEDNLTSVKLKEALNVTSIMEVHMCVDKKQEEAKNTRNLNISEPFLKVAEEGLAAEKVIDNQVQLNFQASPVNSPLTESLNVNIDKLGPIDIHKTQEAKGNLDEEKVIEPRMNTSENIVNTDAVTESQMFLSYNAAQMSPLKIQEDVSKIASDMLNQLTIPKEMQEIECVNGSSLNSCNTDLVSKNHSNLSKSLSTVKPQKETALSTSFHMAELTDGNIREQVKGVSNVTDATSDTLNSENSITSKLSNEKPLGLSLDSILNSSPEDKPLNIVGDTNVAPNSIDSKQSNIVPVNNDFSEVKLHERSLATELVCKKQLHLTSLEIPQEHKFSDLGCDKNVEMVASVEMSGTPDASSCMIRQESVLNKTVDDTEEFLTEKYTSGQNTLPNSKSAVNKSENLNSDSNDRKKTASDLFCEIFHKGKEEIIKTLSKESLLSNKNVFTKHLGSGLCEEHETPISNVGSNDFSTMKSNEGTTMNYSKTCNTSKFTEVIPNNSSKELVISAAIEHVPVLKESKSFENVESYKEGFFSDKVKSPPFACPRPRGSISFISSIEHSLSLSPIDSVSPSARCYESSANSPSDLLTRNVSSGHTISDSCPVVSCNKTDLSSAVIGMETGSENSFKSSVQRDISKHNDDFTSSAQAILHVQGEMTTKSEKFSYNFNKNAKDIQASPVNKSCEELKYCDLNDRFKTFKLGDLSKSNIERKSYEDLLDRCLEQERLLGFDESIKEEADKLIKELANASSGSDALSQSNDFPSANVNNSEAGPVTADEDLNKGDLFQDAAFFDFDYLSKIGKGKPGRRIVRESLFLKFDPLAAVATPEPMEMAQADSSSDVISTPPRAPLPNGDDKLVSITPNEESVCSPASSTVATPPRAKPRPSSCSATPTLRHEILSKEISKLQDLMLRQECSYQEQIAACTEEVEQLREKVAELEARENQENLQEKLLATEAETSKLRKELAEATESKKQLMMIMEEYEKTISQVVTMREDDKKKFEVDKKQISMERDEAVQHLRNMEIAFNDVHLKYEKCKEVIEAFKHNEEQYKISLNENRKTILQQEENYQKLKDHAAQKLEEANIEITEMKKAHQAEIAKMVAVQRKMEIQVKSLEESLEQKKREAAELTKICDDLITKVEQ